jgi:hypothetical protein
VDIHIQNEGTVVLFRPLTQAANDWIEENIRGDAQWFGGALVVEHRYAGDVVVGIVGAGLKSN